MMICIWFVSTAKKIYEKTPKKTVQIDETTLYNNIR